MQQFIPFEDDWDILEKLRPEDLIPYRVGLLDEVTASARPVAQTASSPPRPWSARTSMDPASPPNSTR
jgi:hypothetical protein